MNIFEWAVLGALGLGIMIFCARVMRKGLRTLDDDRQKYLKNIQQAEQKISDDRKNISSLEHLEVARAALDDILRLEGKPAGWEVASRGRSLELKTPSGSWWIDLVMNERRLRSSQRILHGRSRWILRGFGYFENHDDVRGLLGSLNEHLHTERDIPPEHEHFARRFPGAGPGRSR